MKRGQQQRCDNDGAPSQTLHRSKRCRDTASPPLLDALRPILPIFHSLLADADAARLLRTSRTAALALLPGYTFTTHTFEPDFLPSLRRLRDLSLAYQLRITQLGLGRDIAAVDFDDAPPHLSPFPSSLTSLRIGYYQDQERSVVGQRWAALTTAACDWQHTEPWQMPHLLPQQRRTALAAAAVEHAVRLPAVSPATRSATVRRARAALQRQLQPPSSSAACPTA